MVTALALVLIFLFGFYTYMADGLYRSTEVKEAKSYLETIGFVANYVSDRANDLESADGAKSSGMSAAPLAKAAGTGETEEILGDTGSTNAEIDNGSSKDIPGYVETLQDLVDRMAKSDQDIVKIRIGSVHMGAVNGQLIAENGKKVAKGPMIGGEASQNLSMDAKNTFKPSRQGDVSVKMISEKLEDASYHIALKGVRKYKAGQSYDIALVTHRDNWAFPFLPQLFPILGLFAAGLLLAFLFSRFTKGILLAVEMVVLFLITSFVGLFLVFNLAQGDFKKNAVHLQAAYTMNLDNATAAIESRLHFKPFDEKKATAEEKEARASLTNLDAEAFSSVIEAFNKDPYNTPSDGFSVVSVKPVQLASDPKMEAQNVTADNALVAVGWFVGLLLGAGVLWGLARKRGFERLLNTFYNFSTAYFFILPSILGMLILVFIPILFTVVIAFTSLPATFKELDIARNFVGLQNFAQILGAFDIGNPDNFYNTFLFTLVYTIAAVLIQAVLGVTIAVILNDKKLQIKSFYQVVFMLPWIIPTYISGLLWNNFFKGDGVINQLFRVFGAKQFEFMGDPVWSFLIVSFVSAWYAFPFIMLVTLSALQTVPESVYEAAAIDGAGWWTTLFRIVIPMIRPQVLPSLLLSSIWTFNNFNLVYLVTAGYGKPHILVTKIYDFARPTDLSYGYAAAYSALVFIILLFYIYIFARSTNLTEKSY
jgi:ABC-type sugar transport system permease subunit